MQKADRFCGLYPLRPCVQLRDGTRSSSSAGTPRGSRCRVTAAVLIASVFALGGCSTEQGPPPLTGTTSSRAPESSSGREPEDAEQSEAALEPSPPSERRVPAAEEAAAGEFGQDARYHQGMVGVWEDDYEGHRVMTLNEDGTGSMIVELSGWKAALFASRLEFNMRWSVDEGRLKKQTIDGKPERAVNAILKMMGDSVDEQILELTGERLVLLDGDGVTKYTWRRAPDAGKHE